MRRFKRKNFVRKETRFLPKEITKRRSRRLMMVLKDESKNINKSDTIRPRKNDMKKLTKITCPRFS